MPCPGRMDRFSRAALRGYHDGGKRMKFLDEKDILLEDEEVLAVYKRAGTAVQHAGAGTMDLEHMVMNYLAEKKRTGEPGGGREGGRDRGIPYAAAVHRLDQPVEGIVLFAKTPAAAGRLGAQIQQGAMKKEYLAVVEVPVQEADPQEGNTKEGNIKEGNTKKGNAKKENAQKGTALEGKGHLEDYLLRDGRSNRSRVVPKGTPGAKRAELQYELLERSADGKRGLVRIRLMTGRHHQIRVQFAHAGMPLCGDRKYKEDCREEALALCACGLQFAHPRSGQKCAVRIVPRNPIFEEFCAGNWRTGKN